jgi:hypothetical protein
MQLTIDNAWDEYAYYLLRHPWKMTVGALRLELFYVNKSKFSMAFFLRLRLCSSGGVFVE